MASPDLWLDPNAHHPDSWLEGDYTFGPTSVLPGQNYDDVLNAWSNAVPSELRTQESIPALTPSTYLVSPGTSPPSSVSTYASSSCAIDIPRFYSNAEFHIDGFEVPPRRSKLSCSSWETDFSQEEACQRFACSECARVFENLGALDKHTQSTLHKAWRCSEPGCSKSYARRDTFLRHRAMHRDDALSHACLVCSQGKKRKAFKRKDHLRDHMRNCHSKQPNSKRSSDDDFVAGSWGDNVSMHTTVDDQASTPRQKHAMMELVKSLGTVLGDRNPKLIETLGDQMTALTGPDMESIAESMAGIALAKTYLSNPKTCSCPCAKSEIV